MAELEMQLLTDKITEIIGHSFKDLSLLEVALTHRSFVNEAGNEMLRDNERLEFLGDSVLNLAVSDLLMVRYPEKDEGLLSKYRSAIVNERSLASAARYAGLGGFIRLGKGEEMTQGREKDSILANTFEAVVAAVYLTGNLRDAAEYVRFYLDDTIRSVNRSTHRQDFKTALQEQTQKLRRTIPTYRLVSEEGPDHEKFFETEVLVNGQVYGRGRAKSKKDSEQRSAEEALRMLEKEFESSPS